MPHFYRNGLVLVAILLLASLSGGGVAQAALAIPIRNGSATFGPTGCPVAVVGQDVWYLKTGKVVRKLQGRYDPRSRRAISGNGRLFAAAGPQPSKLGDQAVAPLLVWSCATGKKVLEIPCSARVDFLAFSRYKYLLVGVQGVDEINAWDVEAGKAVMKVKLPQAGSGSGASNEQANDPNASALDTRSFLPFDKDVLAFSPDGSRFACVVDEQLAIYETASSKQLIPMDLPQPKAGHFGGTFGHLSKGSVPVLPDLRALRFSPDGQELAAPAYGRVLSWNMEGRVVFDGSIRLVRTSGEPVFEWLPDKSGWIIDRNLYDRNSQRVVMAIHTPPTCDQPLCVLDNDRLLGILGKEGQQVKSLTIPWESLRASLGQIESGAEAVLGPDQPVTIRVQLANPRGDKAQTETLLVDTLTQRLKHDQMHVADGQSTVVQVKLTEKPGQKLRILIPSQADPTGRNSGVMVTEAEGDLVLAVLSGGKSVWQTSFHMQNERTFELETINDQTVRMNMFRRLLGTLETIEMPYFLSKSKQCPALPVFVK